MASRLDRNFFQRDVLEVAPDLLGKIIVRKFDPPSHRALEGLRPRLDRGLVTEVEAYRGEEDLACHVRFGRTKRTEVMYKEAGLVYVYLIYGMYWMLNVVTGEVGEPQAVLVRGSKSMSKGKSKKAKAQGKSEK